MLRMRFRIVFILLVLILLAISTLFGILTYWLDAQVLPTSTPAQGSMILWSTAQAGPTAQSRLVGTKSQP